MLLGVDVGGTFTDAVLFDGESLHTAKRPTTPRDQSLGVIAAVEAVLGKTGASGRDVAAIDFYQVLALYKLARCRAVLHGRDYVIPDDVKAIAAPALGHRLTLKPELWVQRVRPEAIVAEILETVPTPVAEDRAPAA